MARGVTDIAAHIGLAGEAMCASRTVHLEAIIKVQQAHIAALQESIRKTHLPFRFLDLPDNVRTRVYTHCLVVGKVFPRLRSLTDLDMCRPLLIALSSNYCRDARDFDRPETQLLLVSKTIRKEAAQIYFSKNHFVISPGSYTWPWAQHHSCWPKPAGSLSLEQLASEYVRSISIPFDMRNYDTAKLREAIDELDDSPEFLKGLMSEELMEEFHRTGDIALVEWTWEGIYWGRILPMKLDHLELDILYTYCILGCHRRIDELCGMLSRNPARSVKKVVAIGTKTAEERHKLESVFRSRSSEYGSSIELEVTDLFEEYAGDTQDQEVSADEDDSY